MRRRRWCCHCSATPPELPARQRDTSRLASARRWASVVPQHPHHGHRVALAQVGHHSGEHLRRVGLRMVQGHQVGR